MQYRAPECNRRIPAGPGYITNVWPCDTHSCGCASTSCGAPTGATRGSSRRGRSVCTDAWRVLRDERSHRALRGRCEGSCARVRLVCYAHVGGVSRGRAQSEFLPLDPRDIPPSEVILVAEGIRSLLRLQAMRGQSHWIHPEPGGPPSPRP